MLVGQKTGSNKIEFIYDSNGDYYGFEYNDVPYNYIKNLQGDVVAIADGAGNILVQYYYDAWGRILEIDDDSTNSIGTINPIRYRSYYYDTETGFYYLKTRYYSPEICRFLSPDVYVSTGQGVLGYNMFAYCNNNPVLYVDASGTMHVKGMDACSSSGVSCSIVDFDSYYSVVEDFWSFDTLFFGQEFGDSYSYHSNHYQFSDIIFFNEIADEDGSIFDYKIGTSINIKNGGVKFAIGLYSLSLTFCVDNTSFEIFTSPSKSGITISSNVDYRALTASQYVQFYIRPMPITAVITVCSYVPQAYFAVLSHLIYTYSNANACI